MRRRARPSPGEAQLYLVALGSNRRHGTFGSPRKVLRAALGDLALLGTIQAVAPIVGSAPLGPSRRCFANCVALLDSRLAPDILLGRLQDLERRYGRRRGQRWGARVLDLDIVLWSGGAWRTRDLAIPHPSYAARAFVLGPAARIAPHWRDPAHGLTLRQGLARLTRPRRLPR